MNDFDRAFEDWRVKAYLCSDYDIISIRCASLAWQARGKMEQELCRAIAAELVKFGIACHIDHKARTVSMVPMSEEPAKCSDG